MNPLRVIWAGFGHFAAPFAVLVSAVALAACESDGPTDIAGVPTTYGQWQDIAAAESVLHYATGDRPRITSVRSRFRDENEIRELIRLETDSPRGSRIKLSYLPYDTYYTVGTTVFLHKKSNVQKQIRMSFPGAAISETRSASNRNGKYLYAIAAYGGGEKCVYAVQGYDLKFTATRTEMTYDAIIRLYHCSYAPVEKALRIFDGMYMNK